MTKFGNCPECNKRLPLRGGRVGKKHGFEQIEILLVCHGAAHNDTICVAERREPRLL